MSVAAMTMDDQRPLMNNYDKMPKPYEQNAHGAVSGGGAPPSGPASPTPSGLEDPATQQYHHVHHHHHHHQQQQQQSQPQQQPQPHHHQLADQQLQPPSPMQIPQQQQQVQQQQQQPQQQQQQQQQQTTQQQQQLMPIVAEAVAAAEQRQRLLEAEIETLKNEQTRLSQQCIDAQRREKILMRRLANKEQEFQDYVSQIAEYKAAQAPSALALRSAMLDPAVNILFEKMKKELKATKAKLEETQNELAAWKFTPDSNTGKRLMAKCRLLYQENEELGKMTSNGRLAKLETELSMQKSFSEEVKKSQSELDDFLQELDEDVEGMQSTILFLQQELKITRDRIVVLEKDNFQLKNGGSEITKDNADATDSELSPHTECVNGIVGGVVGGIVSGYTNPVQINNIKYETPLETIAENEYLQTHALPLVRDYYNGSEEQIPVTTVTAIAEEATDAGSGNGSGIASKFRSVVSRKRPYEVESNEITAIATQAVSMPRILPPKKSKLRVTTTPVCCTAADSPDVNEGDSLLPNVTSIAGAGLALETELPAVVCVPGVPDDGTPPASEETSANVPLDDGSDAASDVALAQRIMTRRRSLRSQHNGNGNGNGSGEGNP